MQTNMRERCISVDWLQVYGVLEFSSTLFSLAKKKKMRIDIEGSGTRHFASRLIIRLPGSDENFVEVCKDPYSVKTRDKDGIFPVNAATIRLYNRYCYAPSGVEAFFEFCRNVRFRMIAISRLDICLDINNFDNGLRPDTLIQGFFSNKYWKTKPSENHSNNRQTNRAITNSISFGKGGSPIKVKLYDKKLEMKQKKRKPYIEDMWRESEQLDEKKPIWRLEISIMTGGRSMVSMESGEILKIKEDIITNKEKLTDLFFKMITHYFKWKVAEGNKKKSACKELQLFILSDSDYSFKPKTITVTRDSGRTEKMLINRLRKELESLEGEERSAVSNTILLLAKRYRI